MISIPVMLFGIFSALVFSLGLLFENVYSESNGTTAAFDNETGTQDDRGIRSDISSNPNFSFFNETNGLPSEWRDPLGSCKKYFSCTIKFTEGWNDYVSFSLSTSNNTRNTWSSIYGEPIDVNAQQKYQVVTHMKANNWVSKSHIALEGFNQSSNNWDQITQCPFGSDGPLEWHEFNCTVVIPENIGKIRVVLNAGWSSARNEEATTWFDSINVLTNRQNIGQNSSGYISN